MFLRVTDVKFLEGFKLQLTFSDGTVKVVDLENELNGPVFEPLQDLTFFRQGAINPETNTVEWPNGADFAPEFLYEIGKELQPTG
jgi:hypothetical protein